VHSVADAAGNQAHQMTRAGRDRTTELDVQERLQLGGEVDPLQHVIATEHDLGARAVSRCDGGGDGRLSAIEVPPDPKRSATRAIVTQPLDPDDEIIHRRIAPHPVDTSSRDV
jgi:hypothetical protein